MGEELTKQENREAVAVKATGLLHENPPDTKTDGPSEDWLNVFSSHAEKASSEILRQHWAAILAGEIRKPGSFSLATLQLLSVIDSNIASAITTARSWIAYKDDFIPTVGDLNDGPKYRLLLTLDSVGFLRLGHVTYFYPNDKHVIPFFKAAISAITTDETIQVRAAAITAAGKEMLTIVPPTEEDPETIQQIAEHLKTIGFTDVKIGVPIYEGGVVIRLDNERDV
jgi:hypothetical protein